MRRYTLFLIALLITTNYTYAEFPQDRIQAPQSIESLSKSVPVSDIPVNFEIKNFENKKNGAEIQAVSLDTIAMFGSALFTHMNNITPIVYEPISGILYVTGAERIYDQQNNMIKVNMQVLYSTNSGKRWSRVTVFDEDNTGGFWPSIAVSNINNSTNFNEIPFIVMGTYAESPNYRFNGAVFVNFKDGNATPDILFGPDKNNPQGGQIWSSMKLKSFKMGDDGLAFGSTVLRASSKDFKYGAYGLFGWHFNESKNLASTIPAEWSYNKFRAAPDTSTFNGPMEIDVDEEGVLYAAVDNAFIENNPLGTNNFIRNPGVSKSNDVGDTWSDFNQFPYTLFTTYATDNGSVNSMPLDPYTMNAFVVTGVDEYSFFFSLGLTNDQNRIDKAHIVECYYKDGTWGIRKIADMVGIPEVLSRADIDKYPTLYRIANDPLGNEIQVAKTVDGKNLLLKWINPQKQYTINPPQEVIRQGMRDTLSTANLSDVFVAYRGINDNTWSEPINESEGDNTNYKATWIPDIIPSLNNIPMVFQITLAEITNPQHPLYGYPDALRRMVVDIPTYLNYTSLNVEVMSVRNEETYNFRLNDIYPNPANGTAEISYVLDGAANVKIELSNSLGMVVDVLLDNYQTAGIHVFPVNTSKYNSGSYFYTLTVGTHQITKMLNIVK